MAKLVFARLFVAALPHRGTLEVLAYSRSLARPVGVVSQNAQKTFKAGIWLCCLRSYLALTDLVYSFTFHHDGLERV